jgi:ComF family protein
MLDLLLPQRCLVCGLPGPQACAACLAAVPRLVPPFCARCGAPTTWPVARCRECAGRRLAFARARAAVPYDDAVRQVVAGWKERGLRRLAAPLAALVVDVVPRPDAEAVAPLPPDRERTLKRGHHPAAALASELARRWELPLALPLVRMGSAPRQRGLSLTARRRNVGGVFAARATSPRRVVLVDDVYTSGATADAAARALRRAGARRVEVVTLARTIRFR